jgi:hypothetical protein
MFAPLRRGDPISPHDKVVAILESHAVGVTAAALADELLLPRSVIGHRAPGPTDGLVWTRIPAAT